MRIAAIGWLLAAGAVSAQDASPQPGEAEQFVVRFTRALEVDPLGENSSRVRGTLIEWLRNTQDYTVVVCDILGPIPGEKPPHSAELLVQQMFGNVAYQIEHPSEKDRNRLQVAGVESVLKAYSAILAEDAQARIPYLDGLLAERKKGALARHMGPIIAKGCAGKK
ncbi:hypothetical protein M2650_11630 [Luteimonas sp. SX5]|uniref:Uncharacterized protein n=1 Tax=Luteimonas galliterrae TaxID=2940486 RepID=A0ABT0MK82_9GAMM|nr:hypothetical protein [Luteimonas galliterrae]MCL1635276.1 hypothetical protein [Luteimonas galliterrae]